MSSLFRPRVNIPDPEPPWRLWQALACPTCDSSPEPGAQVCPGCGRPDRTPGGALDYLIGGQRAAAERFAADYLPLRRKEGWLDRSGREDPERRPWGRLWKNRKKAAERAARLILENLVRQEPPLVADVGAGGGWLARLLPGAIVTAVDIVEPQPGGGAHLRVVADMRALPFRDGSLNAAIYCSSLQYAPAGQAIAEAARVLRPGGLLVAVESAIFSDAEAAARGHTRAAGYLESMGAPGLAAHHFPISAPELRSALAAGRMVVERLDEPQEAYGPRQMMRGAEAFPTLLARKT
jgi:SAM-dependent methyltransferase